MEDNKNVELEIQQDVVLEDEFVIEEVNTKVEGLAAQMKIYFN